ncbi:hypothetical protein [Metabacillus endolithicus]|uniref:Membrane protein YmcC n=1 Tax=Metabacillus endolithicus TaxID=1535204 RepID=A0ABW5BRJ4_9BACI
MNYIGWIIIACEVSFWIVILLGLTARYLLQFQKLGFILLASTPIIDLLLIIITSIDLYRGASATLAHGIAAVYIGVSLAYGKSMINWMDEKFQFYIMKKSSAKPVKRYGIPFARHYGKGFIKHVVAFIIGVAILEMMIIFIQDPQRTEALNTMVKVWLIVLAIDLYITSSYFIWPKKEKTAKKLD